MRPPRMPFLLVALVLLAGASPPHAAAQREVLLEWSYVLRPDVSRGVVNVEVTLAGGAEALDRLTLLTATHREPVGNVTAGPATTLREAPARGGVEVEVDGTERVSYDVDVGRDAFRPGETLAHLGHDFALFKAESIALSYTYTYYEGHVFRNRTTVRIEAPSGWSVATPWGAPVGGAYALPTDHVTPRGFLAMGAFHAREERTIAGTRVEYVRLGATPAYEADLFGFLNDAIPYAEAVFGTRDADALLVVSAPDPMLRGGLAAAGSFYVHEDADLRTVAHEHAHVHQRFGAEERAGDSTLWLTEGDAELHGALSLLAAGEWTPARVRERFDEAARGATDPAFAGARLPDATYGLGPDGRARERLAYEKGLAVLRALDAEMLEASEGAAGLPHLLRALNAAHGDATGPLANVPVTNKEVEAEATRLAGRDLSAFFARYVEGTEWPPAPPFVPEGELEVVSLRLEPSRAPPGERVRVVADVVNRGTQALARDVEVLVDGELLTTVPLALGAGRNATLQADLLAGAAGDHEVRVLHARALLRSLTPPDLALARATLVPTTPREGEDATLLVFVENRGERAGAGDVEVRSPAGTRTLPVAVEGLATSVVEVPLRFDAAGNATVEVRLLETAHRLTLPLAVDAAETERPTPGGGALGLLAALAVVAAARRAAWARTRPEEHPR